MSSSLAFDARTKPRLKLDAKRALDRVRIQGAQLCEEWLNECCNLLRGDELAARDRAWLLLELMSRFGLPKRTNVDMGVQEVFTAAEMREIWTQVSREMQGNPEGGCVTPVNVEFDLRPAGSGGNGAAQIGPGSHGANGSGGVVEAQQ